MNTQLLAQEDQQNFLVPNGTFFVELIIFLVVLGVIWKWVVPPIRDVLEERAERVAKTSDNNHKAARAFADAETTYNNELAEARSEATRIRDDARQEGQKILDGMRAEARKEVEGVNAATAADLASQGEQVSTQVRGSVDGLAGDLAQRVLGVNGKGAGDR